jgi:hypothetical protein
MDLSPLEDDQRASGIVFGSDPIQHMYNLIAEYARRNPDHEFFGKWGGYQPEKPGKRFVFYVENKEDAKRMINGLYIVAADTGVPIQVEHQYGITQYQDFVDINQSLRSRVKNRQEFDRLLEELEGFPHFFHEFFLTDKFTKSCVKS